MSDQNNENKIRHHIAEIVQVADKLPGVVIIHDVRDLTVVWMSDRGLEELGTGLEEITGLTMLDYHARFFNEDDAKDYAPKIVSLIEKNNSRDIITFFQQVRFSERADWNWHMSSMKILAYDEENRPLLTITMAFPIDAMHRMTAKASRLLEENNFLRRNSHLYLKLGKREREVLRLMALGKSATETAVELFLSLHTVETHRKNIRQKLNTSSYYELCEYARAFDLV